jgi:hypothetical protein
MTKISYTKVSMNLSPKSIENIELIRQNTNVGNNTRAVAVALELTRRMIEESKNGGKIIIKQGNKEKELTILF